MAGYKRNKCDNTVIDLIKSPLYLLVGLKETVTTKLKKK